MDEINSDFFVLPNYFKAPIEKRAPSLGRDSGSKVENLSLPVGPVDRTSIMFTLKNQVGGLAKALQVFQELGINVLHLDLQNTDTQVVGGRIKN